MRSLDFYAVTSLYISLRCRVFPLLNTGNHWCNRFTVHRSCKYGSRYILSHFFSVQPKDLETRAVFLNPTGMDEPWEIRLRADHALRRDTRLCSRRTSTPTCGIQCQSQLNLCEEHFSAIAEQKGPASDCAMPSELRAESTDCGNPIVTGEDL